MCETSTLPYEFLKALFQAAAKRSLALAPRRCWKAALATVHPQATPPDQAAKIRPRSLFKASMADWRRGDAQLHNGWQSSLARASA